MPWRPRSGDGAGDASVSCLRIGELAELAAELAELAELGAEVAKVAKSRHLRPYLRGGVSPGHVGLASGASASPAGEVPNFPGDERPGVTPMVPAVG